MQFYPADWLAATRLLTVRAKGAWIDTIALMWDSSCRGVITEDEEALSRLWGIRSDDVPSILSELRKVAIVIRNSDMSWTIASRRIVRDELERERSRESKRPERERQYPFRQFVADVLSEHFAPSSLIIPGTIPDHSRGSPASFPGDSRTNPGDIPETRSQSNDSLSARGREASEDCAEIPPVTLESAISRGEEMAIQREVVEAWWHDREALGWMRKRQPITRWQSDLTAWHAAWKRNEQPNNATHKERSNRGSGTRGTCNEGKASQYRGIKSV